MKIKFISVAFLLSLVSAYVLAGDKQPVMSADQYEDFKEEMRRELKKVNRQTTNQPGTNQPGTSQTYRPTTLRDEIYYGLGEGLSGGLAKGMHVPISALLNRFVLSALKPASTFKYIQRSIFLTINNTVLSYEKLVQWLFRLNQSVTINMIDPANSSNKVLRRALLNDLDPETVKKDTAADEYAFGINFVINQLSNIKSSVQRAVATYKKYPISMTLFRPYSSEHLEEIIFLSQQLIEQIDQFIVVSQNIKDISQLTDRKDEIQKYLKNTTALLKDLAILVDPDTTFDAQHKGLKMQLDNANRTRTSSGASEGALPAGL